MDLYLKFDVEFIDSEKLSKYKDIFHKIFKNNGDKATTESDNTNIINIHSVDKSTD